MHNEIHIKVAAQVPLKVRRENNGSHRKILICDGTESFYSGDAHIVAGQPELTLIAIFAELVLQIDRFPTIGIDSWA